MRQLYSSVLHSTPDVIIANEPESALIAILVKRKRKTPVIFDIHEYYDELLAGRFPLAIFKGAKRACWHLISRLAVKCDSIIVVSEDMADQYRKVKGIGSVSTIFNSPPIEQFPRCNQMTDSPVTLCHEGWLDDSRGMSHLIKALAMVRESIDVRLLIVGNIRHECRQKYDALINDYSLEDVVTLTGWVPYHKVGVLDANAQIGLVTLQPSGNNNRGLSNKLFSYMACGHAVVVPEGSASHALIESCGGGLAVDVTSSKAISEAILTLGKNPDLREQCGENNRKAILNKYGWNVMAKRLETIVTGCAQ